MKKIILSTMAIALAASAQAQFFVKANVGVGMSAASQVLGANSTMTDQELVKGSFGKGFTPCIGLGYFVNKHIGIELSASYLLGSKYKTTSTDQNSTETMEISGKSLNLSPAVILIAGEADSKIRPYTRSGLVIGVGTKFTTKDVYISGSNKDETTMEAKSKIGLGYTGAIGVSFKASKMISLWVEAVGIAMSSSLKSGEITEYKENGVDKLSTIQNKTWKYEDKLPYSNNVDEFSTSMPLSSIGLSVGATFTFGSK